MPLMLMSCLRQDIRAGLMFGLAGLPAIALYLGLNLQTSGSMIPPAMNASLWDYPGSAFGADSLSGLVHHDNLWSVGVYAYHMVLGNRGMIPHTPILVIAGLGIVLAYKERRKLFQGSGYGYMLLASLVYILIYIFRTTNYSGWAFGVRWFASIMLILCLPIGCLEYQIKSSRVARMFLLAVGALSILTAIIGAYYPFTPLANVDFQGSLLPVNTIQVNMQLIAKDFIDIASMQGSVKELFKVATLGLASVVVQVVFWRVTYKHKLGRSIRLIR